MSVCWMASQVASTGQGACRLHNSKQHVDAGGRNEGWYISKNQAIKHAITAGGKLSRGQACMKAYFSEPAQ